MMNINAEKREKDTSPIQSNMQLYLNTPLFIELNKTNSYIGAITGNFTGFSKENIIFYEEYKKYGSIIDEILIYTRDNIRLYELLMLWHPNEKSKSIKNQLKLVFITEYPLFGELNKLFTFKTALDPHRKLIIAVFKDQKVRHTFNDYIANKYYLYDN